MLSESCCLVKERLTYRLLQYPPVLFVGQFQKCESCCTREARKHQIQQILSSNACKVSHHDVPASLVASPCSTHREQDPTTILFKILQHQSTILVRVRFY